MSALLLTIHLTVTNGVVQVRCVTPAAGSYSVQCSGDMRRWRVVASGHVNEVSHVSATLPVEACAFFRVEWR